MSNGLFAIMDAGNISFLNKATRKPFLYCDYSNKMDLSLTADALFAKGKGVNRVGFTKPAQSSFKMDCELASLQLFSLLTGSDVTTGAGVIYKREVFTIPDATTRTFTLSETPITVLGAGLLASDVTTEDKSFTIVTTGTDPLTGQALVTGSTVEFFTSDVNAGDSVVVCYVYSEASGVTKFTVSAKPDTEYFEIFADVAVKFDADGTEDFVQLHIFKSKPKVNLTLSFDAQDVSKFTLEFENMPDANYKDKNGNACIFEWSQIA